jgi:hypothetical protein
MDKESIQSNIRQYVGIQEQEKLLAERKKALHTSLLEAVDKYGEEDVKGNIVLDIGDETVGVSSLTKRKRTSMSINTDVAVPFLEEKGMEKCIKTVKLVEEDALMAAYYEGEISEEDMNILVPKTVSYAFIVNK